MRLPASAVVVLVLCGLPAAAEEEAGDEAAIESGRTLAAPCVQCHGEDGTSLAAIYPNLAGQNVHYLERQMILMRDGDRPAPLMAGQLDHMSDQDIRDMALFYASQSAVLGQARPASLDLGESIYRGGILEKGVAACTACHAPDGAGNALAGFPRLAGQHPDYTIAQMTAYREGNRATDDNNGAVMREVAANMTDGEIAAVANYILGLY